MSTPAPGSSPLEPTRRGSQRLIRDLMIVFLPLLLTLALLVQPFKVEGASMQPILADHERILVNKLSYRLGPVRRGDVVVFWFPADPSRSFIKRVVGVPGDRVEIREGRVLVNGFAEPEPALEQAQPGDYGPVTVQRSHYFVLGDHRAVSNDSRAWGQVPEEMILGKAVLRYWPLSRAGPIR